MSDYQRQNTTSPNPQLEPKWMAILTKGGRWLNSQAKTIRGWDWSEAANWKPAKVWLYAIAAIFLIDLGAQYLGPLFKDEPIGSFSDAPPPNELQRRHDLLYAQAIQSFMAPATNSMLEIITKNNVRQSGTVDFISHDKVVLDIGGRKHTYNKDWLSPQSREAILAPDYAEAFVRNTLRAEQDKIENEKAKRIRDERERNEAARLKREEAERLRAEQEQAERWKAKSAALKAEKEEARRYNEELQRRADESAARRYAQAESQRQAEQQARIAAQNEQRQKAETRRLMRNVEIQRQRLRETLISQGLDPRLADPENRDEMLRITRARAGQIWQPQANNIRPSGSPPRWQVREGQTRPDGVRTFNENQFIARHDGRYGGAFATAREASLRAKELNAQQGYNQEAMMEQAMYSGQDGVYMLNSRAGNWTYGYDANLNAFVVYQE